MQLLAVACLSLAAKMEEVVVPSLFDFQVISFILVKIIFFFKSGLALFFSSVYLTRVFVWNVG